jgi:hypothetical protein
MTGRSIPVGPDSLSDEWLDRALRGSGALGAARVVGHRAELSETQGAAGVVARLELEYDDSTPDAPRSLVAKFASPYEPIRRLMHAFGGYAREVEFYRNFGADPGIPTPRCYHADIERDTGVFVLLLEDMGDARVTDGFVTSIEDVDLAVRHLAPFHARWWNHSRLRELEFLHYPGSTADATFMALAKAALAGALPAAKARFGPDFPATLATVVEGLLANFDEAMEARRELSRDTLTLVHGDFHPGQIFYPSERGGRFAVFDWQTVGAGSGCDDLARIISTSLPPEERRLCDARLIDMYHRLLGEGGVAGYDIERCREDFRMGLITTAAMNIIASVSIDPAIVAEFEAASGLKMTDAMFGWSASAIEDYGVPDQLPV